MFKNRRIFTRSILLQSRWKPTQWYIRDWMNFDGVKNNESSIDVLRQALEDAVEQQLMVMSPMAYYFPGQVGFFYHFSYSKKTCCYTYRIGNTKDAWWLNYTPLQ